MATATNRFRPDYAVPPGSVLEERLKVHGISYAEFARRCGRSAKLISEIIAGKAPLEPETALQFEKVLGVDAGIWLNIEKDYQLHRARKTEAENAAKESGWLKAFPVQELVDRRVICKSETETDAISKILSFFGLGSVETWHSRYDVNNVAYRHSPSFKSDPHALATWLRLGELEAEKQECSVYNETGFKQALREIRKLTPVPIEEALPQSQRLCNQAGIALVLVKPLQKTPLNGAARWLQSPRKAVIQLSARHKTDDHLWFTFFHEAAHILLHGKKYIFVDEKGNGNEGIEEAEADKWAANFLVPPRVWTQFTKSPPRRKQAVRDFAKEQGISPGIVVGRLQHEKLIFWNYFNDLKTKVALE